MSTCCGRSGEGAGGTGGGGAGGPGSACRQAVARAGKRSLLSSHTHADHARDTPYSWALGVSDLGLGGGGAAGAVPPVDAAGVRALVDGLDFLGVSAYAPFSGAGFKRSELENAAFMLAVRARGALRPL